MNKFLMFLLIGLFYGCSNQSVTDHNEHIVFLVGEGEYKADETMPPMAKRLEEEYGFEVTYLEAPRQGEIPDLNIIEKADLLILYLRFRQPPDKQMKILNEYFDAGKPAVALRTTSHAFWGFETKKSIEEVDDFHELNIIEGEMIHERLGWFPKIFGGNYLTHPDHEEGMKTIIPAQALGHPILEGVLPYRSWGFGGTYISEPLGDETEILLLGKTDDLPADPVAWTNEYKTGSRLFYTSLGTPGHFKQDEFINLFLNSIFWTLGKEIPLGGILSFEGINDGTKKTEPVYPTVPESKIPQNAIVLFDGSYNNMWKHYDRGMKPFSIDIDDRAVSRIGSPSYLEPRWTIKNNSLIAEPGKGEIVTKEDYSNYRLHFNFLIPVEPEYIKGNFCGSGGVYLSGRYEVQILDSHDEETTESSMGAIYGVKAPNVNAAEPPGVWQSMIIEYNHPKNSEANISVWLNGKQIHNKVSLNEPTQNGFMKEPLIKGDHQYGPIRFQADASRIRYANIWLEKL